MVPRSPILAIHDERNGGAVAVGRNAADVVAVAAAGGEHISAGTVVAASSHRYVMTAAHSTPEIPAAVASAF